MLALIVVDVQRDFCEGGALGVSGSDPAVERCAALVNEHPWALVVATLDWHPEDHVSFAATHGQEPYTAVQVRAPNGAAIEQVLWPKHAVQGTPGAALDTRLTDALAVAAERGLPVHYVHKGTDACLDSYSGFADMGCMRFTELASLLRRAGVHTVVVCGLATDYCVRHTAIDAVHLGFRTFVVSDATCGVTDESSAEAFASMNAAGCIDVTSDALPRYLQGALAAADGGE